jgi:hypothetical protein
MFCSRQLRVRHTRFWLLLLTEGLLAVEASMCACVRIGTLKNELQRAQPRGNFDKWQRPDFCII